MGDTLAAALARHHALLFGVLRVTPKEGFWALVVIAALVVAGMLRRLIA